MRRPRSELIGRDCLSFTDSQDLPRNDKLLAGLQLGGEPFAITKRYVRPDGSRITVTNHVSAVSDGSGPTRLLATCAPAPARPKAVRNRHAVTLLQEALATAKRAFGAELINSPASEILIHVYLAEIEGRAITADQVCDMLSLPPELGSRWLKILIKRGEVEFEDGAVPLMSEAVRISWEALEKVERLLERLNHD